MHHMVQQYTIQRVECNGFGSNKSLSHRTSEFQKELRFREGKGSDVGEILSFVQMLLQTFLLSDLINVFLHWQAQ